MHCKETAGNEKKSVTVSQKTSSKIMKSMYFVDIMKKFTLGPAGPPLQRGVLVVLQSRHLLFTSLNPLSCKICIFFPYSSKTGEGEHKRITKLKIQENEDDQGLIKTFTIRFEPE